MSDEWDKAREMVRMAMAEDGFPDAGVWVVRGCGPDEGRLALGIHAASPERFQRSFYRAFTLVASVVPIEPMERCEDCYVADVPTRGCEHMEGTPT